MHLSSRLKKHRVFKWLQTRPEVGPENTNDILQPSSINASTEPREDSEDVTTPAESEDLWAKARQRLAEDKKMSLILEEASRIVEESGLKIGSNGAADYQQLHISLDARVEELKQKELVIQIDDHYIKVREQLVRAIRNVLVLKDLVTAAASASPPVAIICAGMTVSLILFIRAADQEESLLEGLEQTSGLIPRLRMTEDLYLNSDAKVADDFMEKFKEGLVSLYCQVLEFQARSLCFLRKNAFSRMTRNMVNDKWNESIDRIMTQETEVQKFTRLFDTAEGKQDRERISQDFEKAFEKHRLQQTTSYQYEKAKRFVQLLNVCPYVDRKDRIDNRVPGTCEWFTNHTYFQEWSQTDSSGLLWVSADPGCGKSVLSKYLVDGVLPSSRKRTVCYFFFRDDYPDQRRSINALASILRQLFLAQPLLISDSVLKQHDEDGEKLIESFHALWNIFKSVTASSDSNEIICVVDALDECQEDERKQLMEAITDLYPRKKDNQKLKFLLTSRPYDRIREDFRELQDQMPTIHLSGDGEVESKAISREIALVIAKRVGDISIRKHLEQHEQQFLLEKLTEIKSRTYLWVALTLDYIQALDGFSKGNVRETLHNIPRTVYDAYDKILTKSKDHSKARRLLHIVLAAERPLSVEELSLAMALKREDQSLDDIQESMEPANRFKSTLRNICGLMLVVVDNKVYLLHQTVKEFLIQKLSGPVDLLSTGNWMHSLPVTESNKVLAEICTWYLDIASREPSLDVLLNYSAVYWANHFRKASFCPQDRMTILADRLCIPESKLFDTWARIYKSRQLEFFSMKPARLSIPASFGLEAVVQHLLKDCSVEVDIQDLEYGRTPLLWASANGHDTVISLLLETGKVDPSFKDSEWGRTPLSWASANGHDAVVSLLLETGEVDLNFKDSEWGRTPLSWASGNGHDAVVSLLLETGNVDLESKDSDGRTPLSWAAAKGHDAVVRLLLETRNVDLESKDSDGRNALSWAAGEGCDTIVRLLLETRKVDLESKDSDSRNALLWATRGGHDTIVRLLLETGKVDLESKDSNGRDALSWAARRGHDTIVRLLLETRKVDLESKDSDGRDALLWAARGGHDTIVRLLLETGKVDLESKNSNSRNALSWAARGGYDTIVRLLLETGKVDLESKDSNGLDVLSWATRGGYDNIVRLLLETRKVDLESKDPSDRDVLL
ncbi:hypothetical protein VN97_g9836 [Penicillium thymicola]|uniref:Uncharacterized protein n=1 Tax=Penicillium thymicola TaxID=293382 RepID=A0AAI9TB76_PENTH|nr:hypothetical protein VN97_g9836 [Penicillium thymicola]